MKNILVAGAGIIGQTVAHWLSSTKEYKVFLIDKNPQPKVITHEYLSFDTLDVTDQEALTQYIHTHDIIGLIATLPYYCNIHLAECAQRNKIHYFDPTEDTEVTQKVQTLAQDMQTVFAPQCGLAPGFVNIVAGDLIDQFNEVEHVKVRCGALPQDTNNALYYNFTWSPDGLINEYLNDCDAIFNHKLCKIPALQNREIIKIDGLNYEAFNTSGGLGTLADTYAKRVANMTYKTIRYPGHAEKMRFLLHDLKLNKEPETLKHLLLKSIPFTQQDVVLVYISVEGLKDDRSLKQTYIKKYYPQTIFGRHSTAIEITTSAGICSIVDITLTNPERYHGFIRQEQFKLKDLEGNRFGRYLTHPKNSNHQHQTECFEEPIQP